MGASGWRTPGRCRPARRSAALHHRDAAADLRGHAQVMRDEQHGQAEPRAQFLQQRQDLRLHRHIQRRDRLVGDQQFRLHRQRPGDADALALAAAEFVREALRGRRVELHQRQQLARAGAARRARGVPCAIGPSAMMSPTRRRGLSEANGSWNTIWMRLRNGFQAARSSRGQVGVVEADGAFVRAAPAARRSAPAWICPIRFRRPGRASRPDAQREVGVCTAGTGVPPPSRPPPRR